jgi:DNA invertase Pin-like site-specific DNA recombinase
MEQPNSTVRRCAIYTRKSSEEGLDQDFNSLHAQRAACESFIKSQAGEGWRLVKIAYDDGGISGGTMERPALQRLLSDIREKLVDVVVVYKVDRLTRSLADFAKMVEVFDGHGVSFVAVTQQFNTTTSMGRLTLNVLLSFAQFERGVDPVSWSVFGRKARRRAMPKTHPPYPAEYRRRMVELARAGRSLKELAREFEPSVESIRQWVRQAQLDMGERSDGLTSSEREELTRLRREHRVLREEREILSKAAAWFATETGSVPSRRSNS